MGKETERKREKRGQGAIIDEELLEELEFGAYEESDSVEVDVIVSFESAEKMKEFFDKLGKKSKKSTNRGCNNRVVL